MIILNGKPNHFINITKIIDICNPHSILSLVLQHIVPYMKNELYKHEKGDAARNTKILTHYEAGRYMNDDGVYQPENKKKTPVF